MMTLNDIEIKQSELLKKVETLFANKDRTLRDMDELHDEIRKFEKEKASLLFKALMNETSDSDIN